LKQEFGDLIVVNELKDRGITGNFEVTVVGTDTLIHSARKGQGKASATRERQAIAEKIREALEGV